ncbi:MarR family transcriptional regulator [Paenibacillus donghaensis]|uniref:MarR family winged helix-turn-helix transcriptional regulator n=1 Tax=Paenibacillus donghaensis TaxID=414771 RepID=UPI00188342BC|nr:MarR family transcriptional regulator [Paenibacillus donghaensis]MBE9917838.1 MarR family transcriptional regulator [Paenibacillus donghaensis]
MNSKEQILELLYSFRQVHLSFYQTFWKEADMLGTTWIQYLVLRTLRDHPDIGLTELADFILIGNSTTSGVVDRLVKAGLVERKRSETDRRSITLRNTEEGDELKERTENIFNGYLEPLLQIKEEDRRRLLDIHQQIVDLLSQKGEREVHYE